MSEPARAELRALEALRLDAYQDDAGVWTIGYGDTFDVQPGQRITEAEANDRFAKRVAAFEHEVLKSIRRPMNQNQFDALCSLTYNIGGGALAGSEVAAKFNAGDVEGAAVAFGRFVKVRSREEIELRRGAKGAEVSEWQRMLVGSGHSVRVDGDFGAVTEAATKAWAQKNAKADDGVARFRPRVVHEGLIARRFREVVRFLR